MFLCSLPYIFDFLRWLPPLWCTVPLNFLGLFSDTFLCGLLVFITCIYLQIKALQRGLAQPLEISAYILLFDSLLWLPPLLCTVPLDFFRLFFWYFFILMWKALNLIKNKWYIYLFQTTTSCRKKNSFLYWIRMYNFFNFYTFVILNKLNNTRLLLLS